MSCHAGTWQRLVTVVRPEMKKNQPFTWGFLATSHKNRTM